MIGWRQSIDLDQCERENAEPLYLYLLQGSHWTALPT
jgi:hypothetical protein